MNRDINGGEVIRKLIGAILASGLTTPEIEKFAKALMNNPRFSFELGNSLKRSLQMLSDEPALFALKEAPSESPLFEAALDHVERQGISKKEICWHITEQKILDVSASTLLRLPVRELLHRVFENTTKAKASAFLQSLGVNTSQDPYLMGIERR